MTTPLVLTQFYKATFICQDVNQVAWLDRHYLCWRLTGVGAPTMEDFAGQLATIFPALYKALLYNGATYSGVMVQRVTGPGPYEVPISDVTGNGIGTAGATGMAKQTAGLIALYTSFRGRKYQGRQYVPFPATADDSGSGVPTFGYMTRLTALGNAFTQLINVPSGASSIDMMPVIFHRTTFDGEQIQTARFRPLWATQKRRGDFGRTNIPPF